MDVLKHYSREDVLLEMYEYSIGKWIAVEGKVGRKRVFIRHFRNSPLKVSDPKDFRRFLLIFQKFHPRTFYASINIYKEISEGGVKDPKNIIFSSPVIDIDGNLEDFDLIIEGGRILVEEIMKYGIEKGIFLKWSGRGLHIHIHERCFSEEIRKKYHPLDISYSIVEYIIEKRKDEIKRISEKARGERGFKVENKIDIQRVFTIPLSFHRELDLVCVCFKPDELEKFSIDWANPEKFRHNRNWREYEEGEGDRLAEIAIREVGGYLKNFFVRRTTVGVEREVVGGPGRFQVMALLQAARYYILKGDLEKAKSFGLNRAIFYAWAKYYKPKYGVSKRGIRIEAKKEKVGDEIAFLSDRGWFIIGDREQLPEDFDRQIKQKIEKVIPFEVAWKFALDYLRKFPKEILLDQREFFERIYKPVRDRFFELVKGKIKSLKDESGQKG